MADIVCNTQEDEVAKYNPAGKPIEVKYSARATAAKKVNFKVDGEGASSVQITDNTNSVIRENWELGQGDPPIPDKGEPRTPRHPPGLET